LETITLGYHFQISPIYEGLRDCIDIKFSLMLPNEACFKQMFYVNIYAAHFSCKSPYMPVCEFCF
jgi:hypothetical protein